MPNDIAPAPPLLPGLSIILPCFDEEANLAQVIREASLAASLCAEDYELVVVDDGSRDRTREIAVALEAEDPHVRVVVHESNLGYGAALRTGIDIATKPWILLTDADLQFDLTQLADFLPSTSDHDLLLGWRMTRMDPAGRRLAAWAWNRLVDAVFALDVRDVDCAFKLVRAGLVKDLPLQSSGAMLPTELIVRCLARGARIKELAVRHRPRPAGRQSGTSPRVIARAFRELMTARIEIGSVRHASAS